MREIKDFDHLYKILKVLLLSGFITSLLGLYAGSQIGVLDALPQLLIESFLCLYHFALVSLYGKYNYTLCPGKSRNFPTRKIPRPTGIRTQPPPAWSCFIACLLYQLS